MAWKIRLDTTKGGGGGIGYGGDLVETRNMSFP